VSEAPIPFRSANPAPEDAAIAAAFAAGEAGAVEQVRRWIRGAASPYRRKLGAELEDLEQETLLSLTETLRSGRFEGRSLFATYVRRAVLYRCINRIRDGRRRESVPIEPDDHVAVGPSPERQAAANEEVRAALRVMGRAGTACREIWALIAQGLSYLEMSRRIGVAPGTLRVRALRCRQKALVEWRQLTGEAR
jgi:RNA polymerase sigma factor (sigma-70 family)